MYFESIRYFGYVDTLDGTSVRWYLGHNIATCIWLFFREAAQYLENGNLPLLASVCAWILGSPPMNCMIPSTLHLQPLSALEK